MMRVSYAPISPLASISSSLARAPTTSANSAPSRSAKGMKGFKVSLASAASTLTANGTKSPAKANCTMSAMTSPALSCASRVLAPRCGVTTTFGNENSGESVTGSRSKTSNAAPAMSPSRKASKRSCSATMPPRATLITRNDGLAFRSRSRLMSPSVSLFFGRCTVRKSLVATS